jgi:hypothetical protein
VAAIKPATLVVLLGIACTPESMELEPTVREQPPAPTPTPAIPIDPGMTPRWQVGDEWDLRYRISVPSAKAVANPPAEFDEGLWSCAVERVGDAGAVDVVCRRTHSVVGDLVITDEEPRETWRLRFASSGRLVAREDDPDLEPEAIAVAPYVPSFEGGFVVRLAEEWPSFPLRVGENMQVPDHRVTQRVEAHGAQLRVTMTLRSDDEDGHQRFVVQDRERDRPWWSSVTIGEKYTLHGKVYNDFILESHVTAWRLKERE